MSNGTFSVFDLSQVEIRIDTIARMLMVRPLRTEEPTASNYGFREGPPPLKRRRVESEDDELDRLWKRETSDTDSDME